ncbi:MAG: gamma-glutamyl-gamma-aminobutyrate hydrolase family protein [Acidobacteria bacterium]|nr:gamma-glutamyl-gamma-aminobutyrate hydrolase family protein [Acidobacteriota bacterium]
MSRPVVLVPGRLSDCAAGVRGAAFRSGHRAHEAVARLAIARDLPTLAICRGCQVLNVALGGSLHQDLGTWAGTDPTSHRDTYHPIVFEECSVVPTAMGMTGFGSGHSWHHRAIDRPGNGLVVVGRAHDGVVGAVERAGAR